MTSQSLKVKETGIAHYAQVTGNFFTFLPIADLEPETIIGSGERQTNSWCMKLLKNSIKSIIRFFYFPKETITYSLYLKFFAEK